MSSPVDPLGGGYLLLHGTPLTPEVWYPVADQLAGPGPTLIPALEPRPGADVITDLTARVVEELPDPGRPLHVVGHSFGGQIAIEIALRNPDRVHRLTLICTRDTPFPAFTRVAAGLRAGEPVDPAVTLSRWFRPQELIDHARTANPVIDYAERCLVAADHESWAAALDAIACFDRAARVAEIEAPVHVIAAEHDHVSTVEAMSALADRLPGSPLTVLAGAAHLSPFLRPGELAQLIEEGPGADQLRQPNCGS